MDAQLRPVLSYVLSRLPPSLSVEPPKRVGIDLNLMPSDAADLHGIKKLHIDLNLMPKEEPQPEPEPSVLTSSKSNHVAQTRSTVLVLPVQEKLAPVPVGYNCTEQEEKKRSTRSSLEKKRKKQHIEQLAPVPGRYNCRKEENKKRKKHHIDLNLMPEEEPQPEPEPSVLTSSKSNHVAQTRSTVLVLPVQEQLAPVPVGYNCTEQEEKKRSTTSSLEKKRKKHHIEQLAPVPVRYNCRKEENKKRKKHHIEQLRIALADLIANDPTLGRQDSELVENPHHDLLEMCYGAHLVQGGKGAGIGN